MKILKRYKDPGEEWKETTYQECLEHTEESGYWRPGTVIFTLKQRLQVFTPFAVYKLIGE